MTDEVRDMIKHAFNSDAAEFETSFDSIMASKMGDAIEDKYSHMFGQTEAQDEIETPEIEAELETEE